MMSTKKLLEAALALPPEERAHLAHDLLTSLEGPADAGLGAAWLSELEKRARELADGTVEAVEWDVVRERISQRF